MEKIDSKCLVIRSGQSRCLILDGGSENKPTYRLPLLKEISTTVLKQNRKTGLVPNLFLINTEVEIDPWDLFSPFPPDQYYDYGYLELPPKESNKFWENLNQDDKNSILAVKIDFL